MSSPYKNPLTKIKDIDPYFKQEKDGSITFKGTSLEIRIPKKYASYGLLVIGDDVTTLGVMDLIIDDLYHTGINILASITIKPSDIGSFNYEGQDYTVLYLKTGDVFMTSTKLLQDPTVVYCLWVEYINNGKLPYNFDYASLLALFEHVYTFTGSGIGVSRAVYEGVVAQLARDSDDVQKRYRLTDIAKPMQFVALKSISQATESTISKLAGAYFKDDGLTSALRYQVDDPKPFENILRGLSDAILNDSHPQE